MILINYITISGYIWILRSISGLFGIFSDYWNYSQTRSQILGLFYILRLSEIILQGVPDLADYLELRTPRRWQFLLS